MCLVPNASLARDLNQWQLGTSAVYSINLGHILRHLLTTKRALQQHFLNCSFRCALVPFRHQWWTSKWEQHQPPQSQPRNRRNIHIYILSKVGFAPQKDSFRLLGQSFKDASVKQLKNMKSEPSSVVASLVCQSTFKHFLFRKSWDSFPFWTNCAPLQGVVTLVPLPCWRGAVVQAAISNQQSADRN